MTSDTPFEALAELDKMIHSPARLAILTALSACQRADFLFLQNLTGLSKGNLSANLSKLQEAGLVKIEKRIVDKTTRTTARLSSDGHKAIDAYWERLEALKKSARQWTSEPQKRQLT
jgi:DNA-binding transcriptional ArsR family regulator